MHPVSPGTPRADEATVRRLEEIARRLRVDIVEMLAKAGSGHPGGSLSAIDMVVALYFQVLRHDPQNPGRPDRDRFVLSKGHGVPAVYACMAEAGYVSREELSTLRRLGSRLQGHPVSSFVLAPGVEACTGSLGQGLSVAQGMAIASKLDGEPFRVYCLLGDGEMQEGQVWEALMSAPKYRLDNLVAILDYNKAQIDGFVKDVMDIEPLREKLESFNWHVVTIDGHDIGAFLRAMEEAQATKGRPTFVIANTVKGKGVSFMEGVVDWHGVAPNAEQAARAIEELKRS
ncbi:MAG: transketolase [Pseudomonadota bacterium]|nr:MAG: transketolase [Pseudomonadota bacterium]